MSFVLTVNQIDLIEKALMAEVYRIGQSIEEHTAEYKLLEEAHRTGNIPAKYANDSTRACMESERHYIEALKANLKELAELVGKMEEAKR